MPTVQTLNLMSAVEGLMSHPDSRIAQGAALLHTVLMMRDSDWKLSNQPLKPPGSVTKRIRPPSKSPNGQKKKRTVL